MCSRTVSACDWWSSARSKTRARRLSTHFRFSGRNVNRPPCGVVEHPVFERAVSIDLELEASVDQVVKLRGAESVKDPVSGDRECVTAVAQVDLRQRQARGRGLPLVEGQAHRGSYVVRHEEPVQAVKGDAEDERKHVRLVCGQCRVNLDRLTALENGPL